jgi:epoxyqueuosine reductase
MPLLEERLKAHARQIGFELVGIAPAQSADGFDRLTEWLARGFAGTMNYMDRRHETRRHPQSILPTVRSVIMTAMNYDPAATESSVPNHGRIARYARGPDYHDVLRHRLKELLSWLQSEKPGCRGRAVVDTAPLLERDFARRAGLGWFGKNTMLLHPRLGSYVLLGALLVDEELEHDQPFATAHCGTCTACLDACPTDAFAGPGWLDSRRCISYLTIELRGPMPEELRTGVGDWLFGCDICQEVCPWNRKAPAATAATLLPPSLDLETVLKLSPEEFQSQFASTAVERTGYDGLRRNAAIVLGNVGEASALPALRALQNDQSPIVREAVVWAIGRIERRQHDRKLTRETCSV